VLICHLTWQQLMGRSQVINEHVLTGAVALAHPAGGIVFRSKTKDM